MANVPASENLIQQESIDFNRPVSQSLLTAIAALCNFNRANILPVGSYIESALTESAFQQEILSGTPATWVLCDGRSVEGSRFHALTGNTNVPDARGTFLRGKNNGRLDGFQNPDGDLPLGTFTTDKFQSHVHALQMRDNAESGNVIGGNSPGSVGHTPTHAAGGNETAPKSITVNIFIRIN